MNPAIKSVNNQASMDWSVGKETLYYGSHANPYILSANAQGPSLGTNFQITQTFGNVFTKLQMGWLYSRLRYDRGAAPTEPFSTATEFTLNPDLELGYSFSLGHHFGVTPYFTLGYQYRQLDTGGAIYPSYTVLGYTAITQEVFYGIGLLNQWAVNPKWVLSADFSYGENAHPWTQFNMTVLNYNVIAFQRANLETLPFWQLALMSDYHLTEATHLHAGISYAQNNIGSGTTNILNNEIPREHRRNLLYTLGLGYGFQDRPDLTHASLSENSTSMMTAINNQAQIFLGNLHQNYGEPNTNQRGYLDRQTGNMPAATINLLKTWWTHLYTSLSLMEAYGNTQYIGSTLQGQPVHNPTQNTLMDIFGKIGWVFSPTPQVNLIPYALVGYHRWLRNVRGNAVPFDGYTIYVDGFPETYQHTWLGLGLILQWSPLPSWVLSLESGGGSTVNAQVYGWNSFLAPDTLKTHFKLGSRPYYMEGLTSDYRFAEHWHILVNFQYLYFSYGRSPANQFGIYEPTSHTRELLSNIGLGYNF